MRWVIKACALFQFVFVREVERFLFFGSAQCIANGFDFVCNSKCCIVGMEVQCECFRRGKFCFTFFWRSVIVAHCSCVPVLVAIEWFAVSVAQFSFANQNVQVVHFQPGQMY